MAFGSSEISKVVDRIPREYVIAGLTFIFIPLCFYLDVGSDRIFQNTLGVGAWLCLFVLLSEEDQHVRIQVGVAIAIATLGEHFASIYMQGYIYRLRNVPAFVPPGHGLVYLTAVVLARSNPFVRYEGSIARIVLLLGAVWSIWGLLFAARDDRIGFLLFLIFTACLFNGPSARVYLGAFFITSWLELVGTFLGTWIWVPIDPASGLAQGNPPSGVAAWYCLVDAVAIAGAPVVTGWIDNICDHFRRAPAAKAGRNADILASLYLYRSHAMTPVIALMLFL
ncbi:MAG: hypothetical protein ACRERV_02075 [Methylococcales bacterium]